MRTVTEGRIRSCCNIGSQATDVVEQLRKLKIRADRVGLFPDNDAYATLWFMHMHDALERERP